MKIKIEGESYDVKVKVDEITFKEYLEVVAIYSEREYERIKVDGKWRNRREPIEQGKETAKFLLNRDKKIVKLLSTIPFKKLVTTPDIVDYCINKMDEYGLFEGIEKATKESHAPQFFILDGGSYSLTDPANMTFQQWMHIEHYAVKGNKELDAEGNEIVIDRPQEFLIPLFYGWNKELSNMEKLRLHFNSKPLMEVLPIYNHLNDICNNIRSNHIYIYGGGGSSAGSSMSLHLRRFGWVDTLCQLAKENIFGTYVETQDSRVYDVLEYVNCNSSREIAADEDYKSKNNKM